MTSWKKALALALGLPSTIIGVFFGFQELVKAGIISQGVAQGVLIAVVVSILIKMIQVSWNKKK
jgi:prepilin signal peptidase PulO-like enzyme (type II secretory pathway)